MRGDPGWGGTVASAGRGTGTMFRVELMIAGETEGAQVP